MIVRIIMEPFKVGYVFLVKLPSLMIMNTEFHIFTLKVFENAVW